MTVDDLQNEVVGIAVSGGLDSCTATSYLVEKGIDVRCYVADLGQPDEPDLEVVTERMLACGATAAPEDPEDFTVTFAEGVPTKINSQSVTPVEAIREANRIGGDRGIGILKHVVENRYVGIKSRGVYESPGMDLLGTCYEYLLQPVTDQRTRTLLNMLSPFIAERIYQGYWFGPGAQAAQAAVDEIARLVTGEVTVTLYKGSVFFKSIDVLGAPHNLYYEDISTMEAKGEAVPPSEAKKAEIIGKFDHLDSEGLMRIWSLVARTLAVGRQTDVPVDLGIH
jgi:argininosuccinate synthase